MRRIGLIQLSRVFFLHLTRCFLEKSIYCFMFGWEILCMIYVYSRSLWRMNDALRNHMMHFLYWPISYGSLRWTSPNYRIIICARLNSLRACVSSTTHKCATMLFPRTTNVKGIHSQCSSRSPMRFHPHCPIPRVVQMKSTLSRRPTAYCIRSSIHYYSLMFTNAKLRP